MDKSLNSKTMPESLVASVMQSASDYRIGNIVKYNNENKSIGTITALIADFVQGLDYCQIDYRTNKKHWLININPIEITVEWLEKLGFEKIDDDDLERSKISPQYFLDCFHLIGGISTDKEIFIISKMTEDNFMPLSDIKYVHELQNLYFALTKRELAVA